MKLSQALLSSLLVTLAGCSEKVVPKPEIPEDNEGSTTGQPNPKSGQIIQPEETPLDPTVAPSDSVQVIPPKKAEDHYYYCPPCGRG